jgi:hypothetical protein
MIDAALANPRWAGGPGFTYLDRQTSRLWCALLGFEHAKPEVWIDDLHPRVRALRPQLTEWARVHLTNPDNVVSFAYFLTFPAATDLVMSGLVWLYNAAQVETGYFWDRPSRTNVVEGAVFKLLGHIWNNARDALRHEEAALAAFRGLLEELLSRQYAPALELADRVGGWGSEGGVPTIPPTPPGL